MCWKQTGFKGKWKGKSGKSSGGTVMGRVDGY